MEIIESSKKRLFIRVSRKIKEDLSFLKENYKGVERFKSCYSEERSFNNIKLVDVKEAPTFSKMVKDYMKKKGMTSKDIYKNSLINRKLFSSLNVNDNYVPSRESAIMYCFALKLSYEESVELLKSAGYAFFEYSNFDIVVKYFLDNKIYNIDKLNDALYFYTNKCLGYR